MTYRVEINDCLKQFRRAHKALIEELGGSDYLIRNSQRGHTHFSIMKTNWQKRYNITPVNENSVYKYLDFKSEEDYLIFVLKWS